VLSCECDYDEPCRFVEAKIRTCRKHRKCTECRRFITPGERYTAIAGKWGSEFSSYSVCAHCDAATRYILAVSACWCYVLGGRWDDVDDFEGEPFAVRRLAVAARHGWRRRRGPRRGELYPVPWVPTLTQETAP